MAPQIAIISSTRPIPERIYLDHAATTPLRPEAKEAMEEGFRQWANPSSPHAEGRKARSLLEDARERIKAVLGWDGEIIFTSGASEAAERAIEWSEVLFQFVSAVEHDSIFRQANFIECHPVPVGADGAVDLDWLDLGRMPISSDGSYSGGRSLLALQQVNSETGNRQDTAAALALLRERNGLLLVDASQAAGKMALPDADMAIIAAHKFGGPVGVGALLVRDFAMLKPSGGQERGYRPGTENLPGVLAMAAALEACSAPYCHPEVQAVVDGFAAEVRAAGGVWLPDRLADPTPLIVPIAMPGISGSAQVMRFDMAGIAVSQGSACSSGTMKRSRVLEAMGVERDVAERTIRMSIGWNTTRAEVERFREVWLDMARGAA